ASLEADPTATHSFQLQGCGQAGQQTGLRATGRHHHRSVDFETERQGQIAMNERTVHPIEYLGVLDRRKWWFIVTFAVCAVAGIALALFLPPVYRSGAMVAVA